jgi:predicted flap endonuclease-1-like 5' DNA nuclease
MSSNVILMIVIAVLVLGLLVWVFAASRRTKVDIQTRPAEEPARRNQALIDAPPAAAATVAPIEPDLAVATPALADPGGDAPAAPVYAVSDSGDDLTQLKGVGPKLAEQLRALGVTSYAQIAAWDDAEIDRVDAQLGRFQGRIRRDDWLAQARFLAAGDRAGYESKFGRL